MTGDITTALIQGQTTLSAKGLKMRAEQPALSLHSNPGVQRNNSFALGHGHMRGFTLIELMVVIVIAAILLAIAVPSFDNMIRRNTVESLQTSLGGALATARTEAASRNTVVTICARNAAADGCANNWNIGWVVFTGPPPAAMDTIPAGNIIEVFEYSGNYTFTAAAAGTTTAPSHISFNPQGFLIGSANTLITVCDPRGEAGFARGLFVNASGLVMKTSRADGANVHTNPLGGVLAC